MGGVGELEVCVAEPGHVAADALLDGKNGVPAASDESRGRHCPVGRIFDGLQQGLRRRRPGRVPPRLILQRFLVLPSGVPLGDVAFDTKRSDRQILEPSKCPEVSVFEPGIAVVPGGGPHRIGARALHGPDVFQWPDGQCHVAIEHVRRQIVDVPTEVGAEIVPHEPHLVELVVLLHQGFQLVDHVRQLVELDVLRFGVGVVDAV
mmetsp:Transcript_84888/g.259174  ORF Transcript_84888/g.259174 Transcript_84888/m.259174 type:complete len:205 (-) Transcript_84888:310-924(-)